MEKLINSLFAIGVTSIEITKKDGYITIRAEYDTKCGVRGIEYSATMQYLEMSSFAEESIIHSLVSVIKPDMEVCNGDYISHAGICRLDIQELLAGQGN